MRELVQQPGSDQERADLDPDHLGARCEDSGAAQPAPAADPEQLHAHAALLIEQALSHTALLTERLLHLTRGLGLLPQKSAADDPFGPLVVSDDDVSTVLSSLQRKPEIQAASFGQSCRDPFRAAIRASRAALWRRLQEPATQQSGLASIVQAYTLSKIALDLFLVAIAADWDQRFARLFGFLNNDVCEQRPKVAHLLLTAQAGAPLGSTAAIELMDRALVGPGLIIRESNVSAPFSSQTVRVPGHIVELSAAIITTRHAPGRSWSELRWSDEEKESLANALRRELHRTRGQRLVLLEGPPGSGRLAMAQAAARDADTGVEVCALPRMASDLRSCDRLLAQAACRAKAAGRALVVRSDGALKDGAPTLTVVAAHAARLSIPCFVLVRAGEIEAIDSTIRFVRFAPPRIKPTGRRTLWNESLTSHGLRASASTLDDISARYAITPGRIIEISEELEVRQTWQGDPTVEVGDVRQTLRDITVQRLSGLAARYDSRITLADLVFPDSVHARLEELVQRLRHRHKVLSGWSFADKAHESYGVSALFVGPAGTGKTAAAAAIANALEIDLYIVDFSSIMSKWVGETEQNLARVFDEAEASSVALLFDEADSLFGKRSSEQKSASDRYANLTVNYLLQRMERYSGLAILTTNLEKAMDEAFQRRITSRVKFPATDEEQRLKLWRHLLPTEASYAPDVDLALLAEQHELQGSHIRRALTRAAFRAASSGRENPVLTQEDLEWAAAAEYEDMGRLAYSGGTDPGGGSSLF